MAGHSKWSKIKRKKAVNDARRSKMMSKMLRELTVAAREGGKHPESNPRLRTAVSNARAQNIPNDTIERAVLRGAGELGGAAFEDCAYEAYGPHGVALYIEAATDNRHRTSAELRRALNKNGGSLGERNSVAWKFQRKGCILVALEEAEEEALFLAAADAGADDVTNDESHYEIETSAAAFHAAVEALEADGIPLAGAELRMTPSAPLQLDEEQALETLKLIDALEDLDDVSNVYADMDIDEAVLEQLQARMQESAA